MISRILRSTVGRRRFQRGISRADWYEGEPSRTEVERFQVERFNEVWAKALKDVPFYKSWAEEHGLPERIEAPSDLKAFPVLTKATIQERQDEIFTDADGQKIEAAYSTGGTTGTPTRFPKRQSESEAAFANVYAARGWWGLRPFDSYVHVWGHAHLFGTGRLAKLKRHTQDRLVNATRVNAYDMSDEALESHARTILACNPRYVVGYTSAIFRIARHMAANGVDTSGLTNLRAVIVTAETVTRADVDHIGGVFRVPVVIEYGAAETGALAYSRGGTLPLQVLWRSFIIGVADDSSLQVTTLDDRIFPLINYAIGDTVESGDVVAGNALTLGAVTGRAQDVVKVSTTDGVSLQLSAILPVHILKTFPGVVAVQYRQEANDQLRVFLTATNDLNLADVAKRFASDLRRDHPSFDSSSVYFEQVTDPVLTKAGKQALFV